MVKVKVMVIEYLHTVLRLIIILCTRKIYGLSRNSCCEYPYIHMQINENLLSHCIRRLVVSTAHNKKKGARRNDEQSN